MAAVHQGILEGLAEAVYIQDTSGRFLYVNRAAEEMYGLPRERIIGAMPELLAAPGRNDLAGLGPLLAAALAGQAQRFEFWGRRADGSIFPKDVSLSAAFWEDRPVVVAVARDISGRKAAEDALRRSEERLGSIFRAAPVGIGLTRERVILEANETLCRMVGYKRHELLGQGARLLYPTEDAYEEVGREKYRQIEECGTGTVETIWRRKDGSLIHILLSSTPANARHPEQGVTFVALDITARRQAEESLRRSEHFMRAVLESSPLGISVRSGDGRLISANDAWRRIWAIPAEDVLEDMARPRQDLRLDERDDYSLPWWEEIRRVYREGGRLAIPEMRTRGRRPGSAEWISQHFYAIPDEAGAVDRIVVITQDISERKRAEEALRDSERRLADAVAMARLGHWEYDPAGDRFAFNDQFYTVLRTTAEAQGGYSMPLVEYQRLFLHPDESDAVEREHFLAQAASQPDFTHQVEQRVRFGDGTEGWISVRTFLRRDSAGRTIGTYGIIQDVTERRLAVEQLRETSRMLEEAQRQARIGSYSLDLGTGLWQSSPVLDEIFGLRGQDFHPDVAGWVSLIHPDDRVEMERYLREDVVGRGGEFDRSYRIFRRQDGALRWVHGRGRLTHGPDGRPTHMLGSILDITERQEAEEALRRSEAHYREFFEHDLTADYISLADGSLVDCNPSFLALFGFASREEALRTNVGVLYPDASLRRAMLEQLTRQGKLEYLEIELRDLAGQPVHVIMNVLGSFDEEGGLRRMQGYLFDITKFKLLQQQFYQAQKMESIGRLAGGVAHDFNNLLTVINGHVDMLQAQCKDEDPLREQLGEIGHAGERAARLTRQLLAFSRRQVLQLEAIDLNAVVGDMQRMLQRLIGEDVRLVTELDRDCGTVMADTGQLEQVVVNLAVNSRDAMPDGGSLTVATRAVQVDEEFCRLHPPMRPGHFCLLEVTDTGAGMSRETLGRVFEPFYTTKEKGKGTGLGLATVYGIVKQIGGFIWVESEQGVGTTFQIFLPVVREQARRREAERPSDQHLRGSERLLVVEDEVMVRRLAVRMLTSHGYTVREAADGEEALRLLGDSGAGVRLVLSDVIMPRMGGRELVERLSRLPDAPRVIYMSGYTEDSIARHGILDPGVHFIQKPFDMLVLLAKVRAVLDEP
jgi:PAS domain S-box-containing protein